MEWKTILSISSFHFKRKNLTVLFFLFLCFFQSNEAVHWLEKEFFKETHCVRDLKARDYMYQVKSMFQHGFDSYMRNAFPQDELRPISCTGAQTFGNYSLTLIDSLDSLLVMGMQKEFEEAVEWISINLSFDIDVNVSVFETNIRILGALLSAHLFIVENKTIHLENYQGALLEKSIDLANRLLVAFDTPTKIPYGTVNLRYGVPSNESKITCTAAAGSFLLEFGVLSRLTGEIIYEEAARNAVRGLWNARSGINLVGNHINIISGEWFIAEAGIGRGIDSFYEYLFKAAVLFDDDEYMEIFLGAYEGAIKYLKKGPYYVDVEIKEGRIVWPLFDSLQAFWPGLQTLKGDIDWALETFIAFSQIWSLFKFSPEGVNLLSWKIQPGQDGYPLRPELAESAYYLFRSTKDEKIRDLAKQIVLSIDTHCKTPCGYCGIERIVSMEKRDVMDSYFLAETTKYLYLLFSDDSFVHQGNYIFTTEGHLIPVTYHTIRDSKIQPVRINHTPNLKCQNAFFQSSMDARFF